MTPARGRPLRFLALVTVGWVGMRVALLWPDGVPQVHLAPTHTVAGNPDRHGSGAVALREDDEWRTRMPRGPRAVVGALTAPVRLALAGRPGATS